MGGREQVFVIIMIFEGIEGGCFSGIIVVYLLHKQRGYMKRSGIIEQIKTALRRVAPDIKIILYGSEARGKEGIKSHKILFL